MPVKGLAVFIGKGVYKFHIFQLVCLSFNNPQKILVLLSDNLTLLRGIIWLYYAKTSPALLRLPLDQQHFLQRSRWVIISCKMSQMVVRMRFLPLDFNQTLDVFV